MQSTLNTPERERIVYDQSIPWENADNLDGVRGQFARIGSLGPMESGLTTETALELIDKGHLEPEQTQNYSPTMRELVDLGHELDDRSDVEWTEFTGYMIGPDRPDTRITLTGVTVHAESTTKRFTDRTEEIFRAVCRRADEYEEHDNMLHAWWD